MALKARIATPPRAATYNVSLDYLKAFIVLLVVLHHSLLAYHTAAPPPSHHFAGGAMPWRAFPVVDPHRWGPAAAIVGFNDTFFMALMFLLSGLFVAPSLAAKGRGAFLRDRLWRLGIPFLFSALLIAPAAYYFSWLQSGGAPGLGAYWTAWRSVGYWPTGPAWFVLLLLIFDLVAALLFAIVPSMGAGLAARFTARPGLLLLSVCVLSFIAFAPMAARFGLGTWTSWGLLQFQTARPFHYFLYFLIGIALGAHGTQRGLLAADGALARHWRRWVLGMIAGALLGTVAVLGLLRSGGPAHELWLVAVLVGFVLNCALCSFGFLALFLCFARRRHVIADSLAVNSYGIYLVHYVFVAALQYALLTASLPPAAKIVVVAAGAYGASWMVSAGLRRLPLVARLV